MSDRVTNVEIEDVLSAIRRLVSDGVPAGTARVVPIKGADRQPLGRNKGDRGEATTPDMGELAGKLVLTPDFRIAAPEEDTAGEAGAGPLSASIEATPPADTGFPVAGELADGLAAAETDSETTPLVAPEVDAAVQSGIAPDLPFDFVPAQPEEAASDPATALAPEFSTVEEGALEDSSVHEAPEAPAAMARTQSEARSAELAAEIEAATEQTAGDWEPDGSEAVPVMDWDAVRQEAGQGATPIFRSRKAAPFPLSPDLAVPAERDLGLEPEDAAFAFHSSRARIATLIDEEPLPETDATLTEPAGSTGLPDEELLRELVLQVLRQELQGALGERITHNVRRLVRREIHRILTEAEQD
jgi:hypothetical protein